MSCEMEKREGTLPANYPAEAIERVVLRDGTEVIIRPIRPEDAPRLQAGFLRLSPRSVYMRFLETFKQLPDRQAQEFSTLDYYQRMALLAETEEQGELQGIGVARYAIVEPVEAGLAESAIVVLDEYQGRGLGTQLLSSLIRYARVRGVRGFLATVHHTNLPMMRYIQKSGYPYTRKMIEPGVWELHIHLAEDHDISGTNITPP